MQENISLSEKRFDGIDANILKIFAIISMFIDHFTVVFILPFFVNSDLKSDFFLAALGHDSIYSLYFLGRAIGRLAFPIFTFFLAEGLFYTKDRRRYLIRLGIFALISEWPFRKVLFGTFSVHASNVIFTLFLGGLAIYLSDLVLCRKLVVKKTGERELITDKKTAFKMPYIVKVIFSFFICLALAYAAYYFNTDYSWPGVLVILLDYLFMYGLKLKPSYSMKAKRLMGFSLGILVLTLFSSFTEIYALVDLILIFFYNGKRGRQSKYFFYVFYPGHLLLLFVLYRILV